jgi:hypothetical protein
VGAHPARLLDVRDRDAVRDRPRRPEILIGSNQPLEVDIGTWRARLRTPEVRAYLGEEGTASTDWMLARLQPLHRSGRLQPEPTRNRDLFPRDEFNSPP